MIFLPKIKEKTWLQTTPSPDLPGQHLTYLMDRNY